MDKEYVSNMLRNHRNRIVDWIAWGLIIFAMSVSTLMSNFVGWSTIQGLFIEFLSLILLKYILTYGYDRNE